MADPRVVGEVRRTVHQHLSPLMQAKANNPTGEVINMCPFGCEVEDMDDNGYCDHLVGFTNDGKEYEPMIVDENNTRKVMVKMVKDGRGKEVPLLEKVAPSDKLVKITTSYRVYRKTPPAINTVKRDD